MGSRGENSLDNLIEARFEETLADLGLDRRRWQVSNALSAGPQSKEALLEALSPFWRETTVDLDAVLGGPDGLVTREWVTHGSGTDTLALTEFGHREHTAAAARVGETRRRVMHGLTPQEYAEAVGILSVMAANLDAA